MNSGYILKFYMFSTTSYYYVQSNKKIKCKFQSLFGRSNFIIVDNNDISEKFILKTFKAAKKFVSQSPQSRLAKAWIVNEKARRKR